MRFFIDTANVEDIKKAHKMGILDGVTTNPSLVAKEGVDFHTRLREICEIVGDVSVSAEVIALDAEGMIREGKELAQIAPNITVKVPMTRSTFKREDHDERHIDLQSEPSITRSPCWCDIRITIPRSSR